MVIVTFPIMSYLLFVWQVPDIKYNSFRMKLVRIFYGFNFWRMMFSFVSSRSTTRKNHRRSSNHEQRRKNLLYPTDIVFVAYQSQRRPPTESPRAKVEKETCPIQQTSFSSHIKHKEDHHRSYHHEQKKKRKPALSNSHRQIGHNHAKEGRTTTQGFRFGSKSD